MKQVCKCANEWPELEFRFEMHTELDGIELPSVTGRIGTPTTRIQGNQYVSQIERWTCLEELKAQKMYLFWITDREQYGVVYLEYLQD